MPLPFLFDVSVARHASLSFTRVAFFFGIVFLMRPVKKGGPAFISLDIPRTTVDRSDFVVDSLKKWLHEGSSLIRQT